MFFQAKMEYGGSHVIRDCFFDRGNIFVLGARDVKLLAEGNVFRRTPCALDAWQMDDSHIEFTRNDVESFWTGLSASQFTMYDPDGWVPQAPSRVLIANNKLRMLGGTPNQAEGIFVMDQFLLAGGKPMLDAAILNNSVEMAPGSLGGIDLWSTRKTLVVNNKVIGAGRWGISAHGGSYGQILANDLRRFKADEAQILLAGPGQGSGGNTGYLTPVVLDYPATTNFLVAGWKRALVVDNGLNNRLVGQ
jgi:hypothetical protein